jgi:hypothetical protein
MTSQFEKWFVAQHGYRQKAGAPSDLELKEIIAQADRAKSELDRRARWDDLVQTAMYTRNAAPDFKF